MSIKDTNKILIEFLQLDKHLTLDNKYDNPIIKDEESKILSIYLTTEIKETTCNKCGVYKIHEFKDYRVVKLQHCCFGEYKIVLNIKYRRYRCNECSFSSNNKKHTIKEDLSIRALNNRYTISMIKSLQKDLKENYSLKSIARTNDISYSTLYRIFTNHIQLEHFVYELPEYLSIDEYKATCGSKYAFNICDPVQGKVLDILEDRRQNEVMRYFSRFTLKQRNKVKYICTDMSAGFKYIMKRLFPNAIIVVDRFHVVQHLTRNFIKERVRIMNNSNKKTYLLYKRYWKLMLKKYSKLDSTYIYWNKRILMHTTEKDLLLYLLSLNNELSDLYHLYQSFLEFMERNEGNTYIKLKEWISMVEANGNTSFIKVSNTFNIWKEEIIQSKKVKITLKNRRNEKVTFLNNGFIEAKNNTLKIVKRNAYGYSIFKNYKKRALIHQGFNYSYVNEIYENVMMY